MTKQIKLSNESSIEYEYEGDTSTPYADEVERVTRLKSPLLNHFLNSQCTPTPVEELDPPDYTGSLTIEAPDDYTLNIEPPEELYKKAVLATPHRFIGEESDSEDAQSPQNDSSVNHGECIVCGEKCDENYVDGVEDDVQFCGMNCYNSESPHANE